MASTPLLPFNSAQETASWEENLQQQEMTSNSMHTRCRHFFKINTCCLGQSKGHGVCVVISDRGFFNGSRQAGQVCQHLEGVNSRQLAVIGFQIPFAGQPVQHQRPAIPCFPLEQLAQIQEEISSLREKGAISVVADPSHSQKQTEFFSNLFLVPKKNGSMRPVINLKALNQWVETPHFKMEGLPTLQDLLRQGDWLVKVDLKDAYFTVPVQPDHHPYLRFVIEEMTYQFTCLPFGLACTPWVFTKLMKNCGDSSQVMGVQDDYLHRRHPGHGRISYSGPTALVHLLQCLGFLINFEKSVMSPTQELEFLGMVVNTNTLIVSLPADKIRQIRSRIFNVASLSARLLSHFLGKLNAATQAVAPAPLFFRYLQQDLQLALAHGNQDYETLLSLSCQAKEELVWWQENLSKWNGKPLRQKPGQMVIQSDASLSGWGAVCRGTRTGGAWSAQEQTMHINCLELLAATLAMKTFMKNVSGTSVLLQLDNATAVAYINNLGGTVSSQLTELAKEIWLWALNKDIFLKAQHIPGVSNTVADAESRTLRDCSDWRLCPRIFQAICEAFGSLEVDLFASRLTHQVPHFFSWKPDPLAEAVDAFQQDWGPLKGFANPPWCLIGRVLGQARRQQTQLLLVAPVWKGQTWYSVLLEMLWDFPRLIAPTSDLIQRPTGSPMEMAPQLAVWPVSGNVSRVMVFQTMLLSSCLGPGEPNRHSRMIHISESWLAGVLKGVVIPFQDPPLM